MLISIIEIIIFPHIENTQSPDHKKSEGTHLSWLASGDSNSTLVYNGSNTLIVP